MPPSPSTIATAVAGANLARARPHSPTVAAAVAHLSFRIAYSSATAVAHGASRSRRRDQPVYADDDDHRDARRDAGRPGPTISRYARGARRPASAGRYDPPPDPSPAELARGLMVRRPSNNTATASASTVEGTLAAGGAVDLARFRALSGWDKLAVLRHLQAARRTDAALAVYAFLSANPVLAERLAYRDHHAMLRLLLADTKRYARAVAAVWRAPSAAEVSGAATREDTDSADTTLLPLAELAAPRVVRENVAALTAAAAAAAATASPSHGGNLPTHPSAASAVALAGPPSIPWSADTHAAVLAAAEKSRDRALARSVWASAAAANILPSDIHLINRFVRIMVASQTRDAAAAAGEGGLDNAVRDNHYDVNRPRNGLAADRADDLAAARAALEQYVFAAPEKDSDAAATAAAAAASATPPRVATVAPDTETYALALDLYAALGDPAAVRALFTDWILHPTRGVARLRRDAAAAAATTAATPRARRQQPAAIADPAVRLATKTVGALTAAGDLAGAEAVAAAVLPPPPPPPSLAQSPMDDGDNAGPPPLPPLLDRAATAAARGTPLLNACLKLAARLTDAGQPRRALAVAARAWSALVGSSSSSSNAAAADNFFAPALPHPADPLATRPDATALGRAVRLLAAAANDLPAALALYQAALSVGPTDTATATTARTRLHLAALAACVDAAAAAAATATTANGAHAAAIAARQAADVSRTVADERAAAGLPRLRVADRLADEAAAAAASVAASA
ncbi:hypothetical protein HK405_012268 [Cladochytrium tenue]|nr:hypothetical protein HK405_012268 [Cladochytrium tenue]